MYQLFIYGTIDPSTEYEYVTDSTRYRTVGNLFTVLGHPSPRRMLGVALCAPPWPPWRRGTAAVCRSGLTAAGTSRPSRLLGAHVQCCCYPSAVLGAHSDLLDLNNFAVVGIAAVTRRMWCRRRIGRATCIALRARGGSPGHLTANLLLVGSRYLQEWSSIR